MATFESDPYNFFDADIRNIDKQQYVHIFVVGLLFAAYDAYGIGSNDVANAFATSVGAKSLTLRSACFIALFTEFIGAITLGADVADTIKGKIIQTKDFQGQADSLMMGMFCSSIGSSLWVNSASYMGMPVSTTHATVGSTIGVGIAFGGKDSVSWGECSGSTVNECDGVVKIVVSWFISPALAAGLAGFVFLVTKYSVLKAEGEASYWRAKMSMPLFVGLTWCIVAFFFALKGGPALNSEYKVYDKNDDGSKDIRMEVLPAVIGIALGVGGFCAIVSVFLFTLNPKFDAYCRKTEEEEMAEAKAAAEAKVASGDDPNSTKNLVLGYLMRGMDKECYEIPEDAVGAEAAQKAQEVAEIYYEPTERAFRFVQVFTASFSSLSHGANDVANAIGPFCTVYHVWNTGYTELNTKAKAKVPVEDWILAFGGIMIDVGLAFDGWRIMSNLGNNLTYQSPARGFCMEIGALTTVLVASQQGIPVSTTHCMTGATVGVGVCNGDAASINWLMVAWASFGWFITLPCAGIVAGLVFAFVTKAPKLLAKPDQTTILNFNSTFLDTVGVDAAHKVRGMCFVQSGCNNLRTITYFDQFVNDHQDDAAYTLPAADADGMSDDRFGWSSKIQFE
jgi:phosphate/sulfate permease